VRLSGAHLRYALLHPLRAFRYLMHRDRIEYGRIARFLPAAPVIVEAGAHDGVSTAEMAEAWPAATIHAFEPVPAAAAVTAERIRPYGPRVRCHGLALGDRAGRCPLYVSGNGSAALCQSSSLRPPTALQLREFPDIHFGETTMVTVTTLDAWAADHGVCRIDFMWLDMQGHEMAALEGATRLLPDVSAIHMEVSNVRLYDSAPLYPEVKRRMRDWGFTPRIEAFFRVSGNVLFVRSARR